MKSFVVASVVLGLFGAPPVAKNTAAPATQPARPAEITFSGPYTHENLTVFLVHGADTRPGKKWITLQEAMAKKVVKVHETGTVSELSIENSGDEEVFVQSGEIVKGGRQDRVVAYDLIVPAKSGRLPISSFCVEQGRWQPRGKEASTQFSTSEDGLSTKSSKMAARKDGDQSKVWKEVATTQAKLTNKIGAKVSSAQSESSLQLTLENSKVKETGEKYEKAIAPALEGKTDVIGYAFAINGKVNSVEVYSSKDLFKKLWPKLLKASSVEAVSEKETGKAFPVPTAEDVKLAMADAEKGKATEKALGKRAKMVTQESDKNLLFETRDNADEDNWVHRSYMVK